MTAFKPNGPEALAFVETIRKRLSRWFNSTMCDYSGFGKQIINMYQLRTNTGRFHSSRVHFVIII
jgi:hypothetical protein